MRTGAARKNGKSESGRGHLLKLHLSWRAIAIAHLRDGWPLRIDADGKDFAGRAESGAGLCAVNLLHFCADEGSLGRAAVRWDWPLGASTCAAKQDADGHEGRQFNLYRHCSWPSIVFSSSEFHADAKHESIHFPVVLAVILRVVDGRVGLRCKIIIGTKTIRKSIAIE